MKFLKYSIIGFCIFLVNCESEQTSDLILCKEDSQCASEELCIQGVYEDAVCMKPADACHKKCGNDECLQDDEVIPVKISCEETTDTSSYSGGRRGSRYRGRGSSSSSPSPSPPTGGTCHENNRDPFNNPGDPIRNACKLKPNCYANTICCSLVNEEGFRYATFGNYDYHDDGYCTLDRADQRICSKTEEECYSGDQYL